MLHFSCCTSVLLEIKAKRNDIISELITFRNTKAKAKVKFAGKYLCKHECERSSVPINLNTKAKATKYDWGKTFTSNCVAAVLQSRNIRKRNTMRDNCSGYRKREVEIQGVSLRDSFGCFDGLDGSGEHLAPLLLCKIQHNEASVAVLTVLAVSAVWQFRSWRLPPLNSTPPFSEIPDCVIPHKNKYQVVLRYYCYKHWAT